MPTNHLIERQVLDLRISAGKLATGAEVKARDAFLNVGVRTLTKVLDEVAGDNEVLRLDRLIIDLGSLESSDFSEAFGDQLGRTARDILSQSIDTVARPPVGRQHATRENGQARTTKTEPTSATPSQWSHIPGERTGEAPAFMSREQEVIEFAAHFLEFGTAPWWSLAEFPGDPQGSRLIGHEILEAYKRNAAFRDQCFAIMGRSPRGTLNRLINEAWLRPLNEHLLKAGRSGPGNIVGELPHTAMKLFQRLGLESVENEQGVVETIAGLLTGAADHLPSRPDMPASGSTLARQSSESIENRLSRASPAGQAALSGDDEQSGAPAMDDAPPTETGAGSAEESAGVAFVEDSGIVLLQPFIPLLFQELGLVAGDEFVAEIAQVKALRLLEYLAWGTTDRAEFALVLEKRLCAIPDGHPLASGTLDDAELAEADSVLDAAIGHWSALKNTGREGLRTTFLQRAGKLVRQGDQDCLVVERHGVDVLLGTIPWSYGVLRLPWMDRRITVEW